MNQQFQCQIFISHSPGGWKSMIKAWADSASGKPTYWFIDGISSASSPGRWHLVNKGTDPLHGTSSLET